MVLNSNGNLFPKEFEFSDQGKALMECGQEDASRTKTRIVKQETRSLTGDGSGHTVSAGEVWYLTNIFFTAFNDNAALANASAKVDGDSFIILQLAPDSSLSGALNFSFPIKVNAGEKVLASCGSSNVTASATFVGWEEDV